MNALAAFSLAFAFLLPTAWVLADDASPSDARPVPQMPPEVAKALEAKVCISGVDLTIDDLVDRLHKAQGSNLLFVVHNEAREENVSLTLQLPREVTLREAMEIIGDVAQLSFVMRDYGFLITERGPMPPGFLVIPDYQQAARR